MVAPTLPHLSPAQRERLEQLADAVPAAHRAVPSTEADASPVPLPLSAVPPRSAETLARWEGPSLGMNVRGGSARSVV